MPLILSQGHPYVIRLMNTSTCTQSWWNLRGPGCRETQPEERFLSSTSNGPLTSMNCTRFHMISLWHPLTVTTVSYILFEMLDLDCSDGLSVQVHVAEQALAQGLEHSEAVQLFSWCLIQNPPFVIYLLMYHVVSTWSWTGIYIPAGTRRCHKSKEAKQQSLLGKVRHLLALVSMAIEDLTFLGEQFQAGLHTIFTFRIGSKIAKVWKICN